MSINGLAFHYFHQWVKRHDSWVKSWLKYIKILGAWLKPDHMVVRSKARLTKHKFHTRICRWLERSFESKENSLQKYTNCVWKNCFLCFRFKPQSNLRILFKIDAIGFIWMVWLLFVLCLRYFWIICNYIQ
jgi:hypothetical protein